MSITGCTKNSVKTPDIDGYKLLWSDEFNGKKLNTEIWNYETHQPGWTNNELQEYTASEENIFVRDGNLIIKAKKEKNPTGGFHYTSGKITTQDKQDFTYGKIIARAKVPVGKGLWPAIWMMPKEQRHYGQWPVCGEIDILEVLGSDTSVAYATLHYGDPHGQQQGTCNLTGTSFSDDFHEFCVEWEPGEMRFLIDNKLVLTCNDWYSSTSSIDYPYPAPFDQPFFVQLNLAVGGNWPGFPDQNTDFENAEFLVDYVRVYQKEKYDTNVKKPTKQFRSANPDGNFINNGSFAENEDLTDNKDWKFLLFNGGDGKAEIKDGMMVVTTENEGTVDYSVQLVQADLPVRKGRNYRVSFDARADEKRDIIVCVSAPSVNWVRYLPDTKQEITTKWKTYTYDFTMQRQDDNNGRLEFNMGHKGSTATVYIKNVRVEEIH